MREYELAEVFAPGEYLQEELEARDWLQADFAEILGVDKKTVSDLLAGKRGITPDMAMLIGDALGTGPSVWLNLDNRYQLSKRMQGKPKDSSVARKAQIYGKYPVREMIRRGWIPDTKELDVLESELAQFAEPPCRLVARRVEREEKLSLQVAWLGRAYQLAESLRVDGYSELAFKRAMDSLALLRDKPEELHRVPSILAEAGVRFVIVEHLKGSMIDGACFWLDETSPAVALSLRYDRIDNFWFTLVHELAHVHYRHGRDEAILDSKLLEQEPSQEETEEILANDMATEFLVPQAELENFVVRVSPYFSASRIEGFARRIGVHPGIVVGQLQHRTKNYKAHRKSLIKIGENLKSVTPFDGWGVVATFLHEEGVNYET